MADLIGTDENWGSVRGKLNAQARGLTTAKRLTRYQIVSHHGDVPHTLGGNGAGLMTRDEGRWKQKSPGAAIRDFRVVDGNWRIGAPGAGTESATGGEQAGPNDINIARCFELANGVSIDVVPVYYNGAKVKTVAPGATVFSDPVGFTVPADTEFWLRCSTTVASAGQQWPVARIPQSGENGYQSTAATSQIDNSGPFTNPGGGVATGTGEAFNAASALCILGIPETPVPAIIAVTDSIGNGALASPVGDGNGNYGFLATGTYNVDGHAIPLMKLCRDQDQAQYLGLQRRAQRRLALMRYGTDLFDGYGTNDLVTGARTVAQLQADKLKFWAYARSLGLRVWVMTLLPRTDAAGTTPLSGFEVGGKRDQINTWVRSQVGVTIDGIVDMAAVYENPALPGTWLAGMTDDGTHPKTSAHALGVPTIQAWGRQVVALHAAANPL